MIFRAVILVIVTIIGLLIGLVEKSSNNLSVPFYVYPIIAFVIAGLAIVLEIKAHQAKGRKLLFGSIGIIIGGIIGLTIGFFIENLYKDLLSSKNFKYIFPIVLSYVGFTLGWLKEEEIKVNYVPGTAGLKNEEVTSYKILDTSVIIDGRISDIAETGFLEGFLVVPKFVLNELQQVADSSDPLKRSRGRRGLDILNTMKASKKAIIKITEEDFPEINEVDSKLLKLAHFMKGTIVTNDFNLNKVAEFQGVAILNINDLANAIKPVLLPNEEIRITVIKEGKDQNQGIAYLDDGTMIVIDNGRDYIGKEINVVVTSILQTPAGRMIFTQINDDRRS